jgi:hypothetical protein
VPVRKRITRCTAAVALTVTAGAQPVFANQLTCVAIKPGDTAASLAQRLTGDASHRHEPWFYMVDPTTSGVIPKAAYERILPGWHVCFTEGRLRSEQTHALERPPDAARPVQPIPAALIRLAQVRELWWGLSLLLAAMLAWELAATYGPARRALVNAMTHFGERFIREFERPLMLPDSEDRALVSRLRCIPGQRRLDILIAPQGRRTYPNLSDHRTNVEYDVSRVLQLLRDDRFVGEGLSARGRWVIVRCRVRADAEFGG